MMKLAIPNLFLTQEVLLPLLSLAGLLLVLGLRRTAGGLIVFVLGSALFLPMLKPIVEFLIAVFPGWAIVFMLVIVVLNLLRALAALFLGQKAADQMVGTLAADIIRFLFLLSFRGLRHLVLWLITRR